MNKHWIAAILLGLHLSGCQAELSWKKVTDLRHTPWVRQVRAILFPKADTGPDTPVPPRPQKPKKVTAQASRYRIMSNVESVTSGNIRRMQMIVRVPEATRRVTLKYICQDIVKKYKDKGDIIWIFIYREGQAVSYDISNPNSPGLAAKAHWFAESVPPYAQYKIASPNEIFYGITIEYRQ